MSKTFSEKIDKSFDVSFSSISFVLSRFRLFLSDVSSKTLHKTLKKCFEKLFQKKSTNNCFFYFLRDFSNSRD
jgi:hypothetical protein